jgi:hypothetical protein
MKAEEVAALEERIRAEYEEKLRAIKIVRSLLSETQPVGSALKPTGGKENLVDLSLHEENGETLIGKIQELFQREDQPWTVPMIEKALRAAGFSLTARRPAASIASSIHKLKARGVVKLVKKGSGRRPNRYRASKWLAPSESA